MNYKLIKVILNLFSVSLISCTFLGVAQSDIANHRKYWYYKTRLNNDFMKVGLGNGESIPFNQRGKDASSKTEQNVELYAGDATSTLGYYIAMLATEYYLLSQNNQSTDSVKHELFCALNAINRLDYKAEAVWQVGAENLNGFFIRDDIPTSLLNSNYNHFNYDNLNNNGFHSKMANGANKIDSDWKKRVELADPLKQIAMSQDQVYNLLFGLAFVNKFVPGFETDNGNIFGYGSGQILLTQEARNIASRIINFVKDSKDLYGNSCNNFVQTGWRISNPTTCNLVSTGDNMTAFAYPVAEIGCIIKSAQTAGNQLGGVGLSLLSSPKVCGSTSSSYFHNYYSSVPGFALWKGTANAIIPNIDNRVQAVNLMAACNCVYGTVADEVVNSIVNTLKKVPVLNWLAVIINWVWTIVSTIVSTIIPGYYVNTTSTAIMANSYFEVSGFKEAPVDHGPLARKVLHGGVYIPNSDYTFKYLLDIAPCDNIYNFGASDKSTYQWNSDSRLDHPNRRGQDAGSGSNSPKGEYNGIDYMLYHNLWYIHELQQGNSQNIIDLSDIYINYNNNTAPQGPSYDAYETIVTENTTFAPQNNLVSMRAGKTIHFKPGTEIKTGPSNGGVHAYIDRFLCATDMGSYRSGEDNGNHEYPEKPYHYVAYPKDDSSLNQTNQNNNNTKKNYITELPDDDEIVTTDKITIKAGEFKVYPNPTTNTTKMYFTLSENEKAKVVVTDLVGKVVLQKEDLTNANNGNEIDLTNLVMGSYIIYYTHDGITKSVKLVKIN